MSGCSSRLSTISAYVEMLHGVDSNPLGLLLNSKPVMMPLVRKMKVLKDFTALLIP